MSEEPASENSMPPALPPAPKPKLRMHRKKFSRCIVLRQGTGIDAAKIEVPLTAADHQARQQIIAAKLQKAIEDRLDAIEKQGAHLTPKEYSELVNAAKMAADLGFKAHGGAGDIGASPSLTNSAIGNLVAAGVRAGASLATDDDFTKALGDIDSAAKKAKQVIDVSAEEKK